MRVGLAADRRGFTLNSTYVDDEIGRKYHMKRFGAITLMAVLVASVSSYANEQELATDGTSHCRNPIGLYIVMPGDTLVRIGARKGVEQQTLAAMNGLKLKSPLKPGQVLKIDNRHIVAADLRHPEQSAPA
jgi:hypothetical protein